VTTSSRLPAPQRRRQLLDRALGVFAAHGFHDTSMNDIAEAAGVTKPVLYQHFRSKRALYLELVDDVGNRMEEAIVKAVAQAPGPREQVEAGFQAFCRFVVDDQAAFQLLFASGSWGADPEFTDRVRRVEDTLADDIAALINVDGLPAVRRRLLAHSIVGLTVAACRQWMTRDLDLDPDALALQLAELVWAGLRGIHSPPG
jgi:AcrR family transcriptional regulator